MNFEHVRKVKQKPDALRATITAAGVGTWSNIDYIAVIAIGEVLADSSNSTALGTLAAMGLATSETLGTSYVATKGMGDFKFDPKSKLSKKAAAVSPLVSIWRGAGTGVMIDQSNNREVTLKRRFVHSIPYGVAVGSWVATPLPETVSEAATNPAETISYLANQTQQLVASQAPSNIETQNTPVETFSGVAILAAAALGLAVSKIRNR